MSSVKKAKANTAATTPPAPSENEAAETKRFEALLAELEAEKQRHRNFREESCLDELQSVLERRNCSLSALPDGRFHVVWKG